MSAASHRLVLIVSLALCACLLMATSAKASFGIEGFDTELLSGGAAQTQAGSHPEEMETTIDFAKFQEETAFGPLWMPDGQVRNVRVQLPTGFFGSPAAVGTCTDAELMTPTPLTGCPLDSQVGIVEVRLDNTLLAIANHVPLFNMVAPDDSPAILGFRVGGVPIHLRAEVRSGTDLGIDIVSTNVSQALPVYGTKVTVWGVPASSTHDGLRGKCLNIYTGEPLGEERCPTGATKTAFLSTPTTCTAPLRTDLSAESWQGVRDSAVSESHELGNPAALTVQTGCERLPFDATMKVRPEVSRAGSPSQYSFDLAMPQSDDPGNLAQSHLKKVVVKLPQGVVASSAAADGLGSCPDAQANLGTKLADECPASAKVGTVSIDTPALQKQLKGAVYLMQPQPGNLFRLLITAEGPGVVLKLRGDAHPDPVTGQMTAVFDDNPQAPFSNVHIAFKDGPRALLNNPQACGTYTTETEFTAWNGKSTSSSSSFTVNQNCNAKNSFTPGFAAGTKNPVAGDHSPFTLRVTRPDGQQNVASIQATLPEGVLAKLAGVPLCGDAEANTGNCPASSQVGKATVGVGAGSNLLYVPQPGKPGTAVYLAGPYRGAPYSLVAKVPAQAGPFDLGTVAVRNTINVDPTTAQVSVKSDPLPQILQGIPIAYRDIRVNVDKPQFTLNPTSCNPMEVKGVIGSAQGTQAKVSDRFQVASCERLQFKPKLTLTVKGPTHRSAHPRLKAVLTMPKGGANIEKAQVILPKTEILENAHIRTICTRVQYNAGKGGGEQCPKASVYGKAKAWSPLLDKPLQGPVYLRSSSNELPDLVASLDGQIHVDLVGRIDAVNARIRNTFEGVPDAPVSKFVLEMQGGKKGLLVNNTELCRTVPRASVRFDGQNGKLADSTPVMRADCGKARKGAKKRSAKR
jgi:hypothetical protein